MSVLAVEKSVNAKTGPCSATYVSQSSCPDDCALRGSGCMAEHGILGMRVQKLNDHAPITGADLAALEAYAIERLTGPRALRLHIVGDCVTDTAARLVAAAARQHTRKHSQPVWTYTHAWRTVRRASWTGVSVLASCESPADTAVAANRGYASALLVDAFPGRTVYAVGDTRIIPCPAQTTRGVTCTSCRLCWDDHRLLNAGLTIGFAAHGSGRPRALRTLPMADAPARQD